MIHRSKYIIVLVGLLLSYVAEGQRKKLITPYQQILALKDGVLLVELQRSNNYIKRLKDLGQTERAEEFSAKEADENRRLIDAFTKHFDFCPYYFFYSDQVEAIKTGNFSPVFSPTVDTIRIDTTDAIFFCAYQRAKIDTEFNLSKSRLLVLMDQEMNQLEEPFPHHSDYYTLNRLKLPPKEKGSMEPRIEGRVYFLNESFKYFHGGAEAYNIHSQKKRKKKKSK